MTTDLNEALRDVKQHREEIINRLVQYAETDLLLFWGTDKELKCRQEKVWAPIIYWANEAIKSEFRHTESFDIPEECRTSACQLKVFMESLSDKELTAFYSAALNMKSVLLAMAMIKRKINAEEAFHAAFLDELWQNEKWGADEEAVRRRELIKQELSSIEAFLGK